VRLGHVRTLRPRLKALASLVTTGATPHPDRGAVLLEDPPALSGSFTVEEVADDHGPALWLRSVTTLAGTLLAGR
jgi:hypothetical protein